jgi:hypothetical protein
MASQLLIGPFTGPSLDVIPAHKEPRAKSQEPPCFLPFLAKGDEWMIQSHHLLTKHIILAGREKKKKEKKKIIGLQM